MYTKTAVIFACIVAGGFALWLFFFTGGSKDQNRVLEPKPTFILPESKVGFRFDTTLYRLAKAGETLESESVIPPCDAEFEYCIYRTRAGYEHTNFQAAGLRINERAHLSEAEACMTGEPGEYSGLTEKRRSGEGYEVSVLGPRTGGAAGHTSFGARYRLFMKDRCYEFETRVAEAQFENYPPHTRERFSDAEREIVYGELVDILSTTSLEGFGVPVVYPSLD